ncbi:NUDIX domain-containing protein [Escherichia coli]
MPQQAAVLIPIVRRPEPGLLLTQRSVACANIPVRSPFRRRGSPSDASLIAAALREAQEEVAIPPECVDIIGVFCRRSTA